MSAADLDDEADLGQARRIAGMLGLDAADVARVLEERRHRRAAEARRRRAVRRVLLGVAAAVAALLAAGL